MGWPTVSWPEARARKPGGEFGGDMLHNFLCLCPPSCLLCHAIIAAIGSVGIAIWSLRVSLVPHATTLTTGQRQLPQLPHSLQCRASLASHHLASIVHHLPSPASPFSSTSPSPCLSQLPSPASDGAGRPEFEDLALGVHDRLEGFVGRYGGLLPLYFNPESGTKGRTPGGVTITLGGCHHHTGWVLSA